MVTAQVAGKGTVLPALLKLAELCDRAKQPRSYAVDKPWQN
ncbi:hypothetical protein CCP3SC5AM1_1970005 [Gammaproteobacteria bacterium]